MQPFFRASLAAVLLAALPVWAQQGTIQGTVTEVLKALDIAARQTEQGIIRGTVTDGKDATPLPSANLNLVGTMRGTMTGDDGTFFLAVPPGSYTLQATFIGYQAAKQSVEVAAGEMATVDFSLNASPVALGEEFVVVGSRTVRTAIETPAPVDVISELEIRQSGQTEINQTLRQLAPSFNASHQTIADGTDHINPASLRGLGPDQVLVLINGKRRHSSALVRATNYGPVEYKPNNPDHDETFSAKTLLDVDVSYQMLPGLRLSVGANNLLNTFPDEHEKDANITSRGFVYSRRVMQFGTNGGFYYGRLSFDL